MTTNLDLVNKPKYANEKIIGVRHIQCLLSFFCLTLAYGMRVNLSVALVAMSQKAVGNATGAEKDTSNYTNAADLSPYQPEYYFFTETQKSYMLSSFFWGYICTQVPGGYIAQRYGAKTLLLAGIMICSTLTILTPLAVSYGGWMAMCLLRILEGLAQGAVHPATHTLLAKWSPVKERGMLATICYSGAQFGTILMLATSGVIADSVLAWPGIFYISGLCGFIWVIFWYLFCASSPDKSRFISVAELKYIEDTRTVGKLQEASKLAPTPWSSIFTSLPFLSLMVVHCTHMWGFWTLLTQIPSYMMHIYDVDIKSSALLSSLPYIVMMTLSFMFIWLSTVLQKKESVSLNFNRKFFNTIGHWIPMCSLIALGYVPRENSTLAVVLLTVTVGISAATYLGFQVNHIDLSPNYAGTLMGVTNGAANVMSALAPLAVGQIVQHPNIESEWRYVFFLAAFFYFIGNLLFLVFGKTDIQPWDAPDSNLNNVEQGVPLTRKVIRKQP